MAVGGAPTRWKLLQEGKIDAGLQPFPQENRPVAQAFLRARLKILSPDLSVSDAALGSTFETVFGVGLLPPGSVYERGRMLDSSYLLP